MNKSVKRALALGLCACLSFTALAGCSKKSEDTLDETAAMVTLTDGGTINVGTFNTYLRYEQAEFETGIGAFIMAYYGDIWNTDLTGSGETYGETFKEQLLTQAEYMLLDEAHMEEYGVELTEEDETAIAEAAEHFIEENDEEVLTKMSATQENVEEMLRLLTIQAKMEAAMCVDVDTEVSDEEAAQRTVQYVQYTASTEAEEEEVSEAVSEAVAEAAEEAEEVSEAAAGAADTLTDAAEEVSEAAAEAGETVSEAVSEVMSELSGDLEEEETSKTGSADVEEVSEAVEEAVTEAEAETETESAEMAEARAKTLAMAEDFLARAAESDDFEALAEQEEADNGAYFSSFTFGADDTYPDSAIIEATEGLEDNTLVDQVIVVGTSYYVLYVSDAFDEEATEEEKENIVSTRKSEQISSVYTEWLEDAEFTVNSDAYSQLIFDFSVSEAEEESTEYGTESLEDNSESVEESAALDESQSE